MIDAIGQLLEENGFAPTINNGLKPARVLFSYHDHDMSVGICDGHVIVEDMTNACNPSGFKPVVVLDLADPLSLDQLLEAIRVHCGDSLDKRPLRPSSPTTAS